MSERFISFKHHFLIATPGLMDPVFRRTVVYLIEHNRQGAMGLVINRPLEITLGQLFERVEATLLNPSVADQPVYFGGPVAPERGFVLHRPAGQWAGTIELPQDMALTSSRDILGAIGAGDEPHEYLVLLGHAGWGEGQLDAELAQNAWLTVPADPEVIFATPAAERYEAALALLGIRESFFVGGAGHV